MDGVLFVIDQLGEALKGTQLALDVANQQLAAARTRIAELEAEKTSAEPTT